ncbi:major facilitator superfamily domain-containing protein [Mycena filopes]|nr:major facilitator superfamily domain-containing protein [Mycena filopes]
MSSSIASSSQREEIELPSRGPLPTSEVEVPIAGLGGDSNGYYVGSNDALGGSDASPLPPVDGGIHAWSFLAAAFVLEAIVWGFPTAYGVFLEAYLQDPRYASQKGAASLLPLIGTLSSGIPYFSGPFLNPIASRFPQHRRKSMWFGAVLCCGSLLGASYANQISHLVVLQGVVYSVGGALLYLPCIPYMSEWFVARRGLANGILFAGTGAGGVLLPLVLPPLITRYGISKTLRILAVGIAFLLVPLLPLVKGRLPQTRTRAFGPAPRGAPNAHDWMRNKTFWLFLAVNTLQSLAYSVPIVYLPTFANYLGISRSNSAVTLAMLNAASVVGRLSMGYLSDKFNPWLLALVTLLSTSVATFVLWGVLSHSFGGLLAFGIAYGSVAGSWTSLWTGFVRPVAKDDPLTSTALFGYILLSSGIGNIVSTPISAKLYANFHNITGTIGTGFDVGDGRFEKMIIYVGTCFAGAAGIAALGWAINRKGAARNDQRQE